MTKRPFVDSAGRHYLTQFGCLLRGIIASIFATIAWLMFVFVSLYRPDWAIAAVGCLIILGAVAYGFWRRREDQQDASEQAEKRIQNQYDAFENLLDQKLKKDQRDL